MTDDICKEMKELMLESVRTQGNPNGYVMVSLEDLYKLIGGHNKLVLIVDMLLKDYTMNNKENK